MNAMDFNFWFFGPTSIWFLGAVILFLAIVALINTNKIIAELKKTTNEVRRGATELERITSELREDNGQLKEATSELRKDTGQLTTATSSLKEELGMTRQTIDNWHQTIQRLWFWLPLGGKE